MDTEFWHERWQKHEIAFHQGAANDLLKAHWARIGVPAGAEVFVPLSGKSLDMVWLAGRGHRVIGAELSEIAVDEFFASEGFAPKSRKEGSFVVKSAGPYELWCGDIFEMPAAATARVGGVYDRAALIAFPPEMQKRYADKLLALAPAAAPMLLVTLDYDPARMQGPPFATPRAAVDRLFGDACEITELARRSVIDESPRFRERGLAALDEYAYRLRRR
jgi:thiopurine S-methyltransferase